MVVFKVKNVLKIEYTNSFLLVFKSLKNEMASSRNLAIKGKKLNLIFAS